MQIVVIAGVKVGITWKSVTCRGHFSFNIKLASGMKSKASKCKGADWSEKESSFSFEHINNT